MPVQAQDTGDEPDGGRSIYLPAISAGTDGPSQQTDASIADAAGQGKSKGLSKHDRELLADATAEGKPTVTLLIAAFPGSNKQVVTGITGLGGSIA